MRRPWTEIKISLPVLSQKCFSIAICVRFINNTNKAIKSNKNLNTATLLQGKTAFYESAHIKLHYNIY